MREEELKELARALGTLAATIEARDQRQHAALERDMAALRALAARNGDDINRLVGGAVPQLQHCLLYTSPSPRDRTRSRMPSSA